MSVATAGTWRPLRALLGGQIDTPARLEVSDLTLDSRSALPGSAFLAVRGSRAHGLAYAREAVARGARVVLWEPAPGVVPPTFDADVHLVAVPDLAAQAGYIADRFFDAPSAALQVTGITGTNGKTTSAWLLAQALEARGTPARYLGTLGAGRPGELAGGTYTTPDAITLHRLLAAWRDAGVRHVALEVSSHALEQGRCAGVRFQTAVFTNLTRDHLDYHGSMERYGTAKAQLFEWPTLGARVINVDDPFGVELAGQAHPGSRLIVTTQRSDAIDARLAAAPGTSILRATHVVSLPHGLALEIEVQGERLHLKSALLGEFNVSNLLGVLGCLLALDVSPAEAVALLERGSAPPGRMQTSGGGDQPLVIVDYAHTADALEKALQAARAHCAGRLWCVFGCGGDRDPGKRAPMGQVAERLADEIIVTDDNPRDEDPAAIVQAILAGITRSAGVTIEHDRATAIGAALMGARVGDVVLIAGKGHEDHQVIGPRRQPFSDIAVVRTVLAARGAA